MRILRLIRATPLAGALLLAACAERGAPAADAVTDSGAVTPAGDTSAASIGTDSIGADSAVALARGFLRTLPERASYLPDSVRVLATDSSWQVFVRHVEWEIRRPPETLLEVSRVTGRVTQVPLK